MRANWKLKLFEDRALKKSCTKKIAFKAVTESEEQLDDIDDSIYKKIQVFF